MASMVDGHHLDCPAPFPSPSDACSVGEMVAEEPLATILPSPEEGLSVFFLSGSPPRTPSPTTFDHQRGNLHHYNHQYHQQRYHDRHKHHHLAADAPMDNRCVIAITQTKEGDFEAVGSAIHKGTSSKDCDGRLGTMGRCVIPVVSDKEVGHFEMERPEGEITQRQPYSRDWLTSREPSARIVLKGAIAFTHDGEGTDEQAYRKNRDTAQVVDELTGEICRHLTDKNRGVSIGDMMTGSCNSSYLESYLPEAPPRRSRSRNRVCSDSSVYITGDDDVVDHQSASHDLSGEGRYGSSLVITLSYNQHDEDERILLPSDPADTEDDSVFAGYLPDSQTNASDITDMYRTSKPPSKKRYSASDFIRDTIWAPLDKQSDFNSSVQAEYSTQPIYANVPETQPEKTTNKHTSQDYYFESRTEKESKHSETNLNLPPRENLESSAINEANKCATKIKQSEKRMVNIEFITRPLPPSSDEASAIPSPPPRTKSPSKKKKKSRARSSSPPKSDTTNDFPHPRRARSCCLHYREGLRLQEYLQENGITPTSLLDSFFESGMVEDDLGQLPSDFKFCQLYQNMSALQMAAEGRDYLMWCPDHEFDNAVAGLDIRGLVELVQTLQDAMAVEQQTFDSLSQQLELVYDPLQQQRLSAALCTSQTRLARLCSRNMRCFRQQALKARQKESLESRSSSPRDSGLVMSSSDAEGDPRSPSGASFRSSLAFFQRAAHLVANNTKNTRARHKEARRRSSRGSSSYGSSSSEASEDPSADPIGGGAFDGGPGETGFEEDLMARFEDQGTYEQVLFINGRPQYPEDLSWTCDAERNSGNTGGGIRRPAGVAATSLEPQPLSATHSYPATVRRVATDSLASAAEAQTQTQAEDVGGYVTLPRRKPYLNFKSVSSAASNPCGGAELDNEDLRYCRDRIGVGRKSDISTITRAQSFKEGLNCYSNDYPNSAYGLSRTRSFHDGLASDFNELESVKPKLQRAPSVDEILESVKSLRAKKTMVKSTPDLLSAQEPVYHSASLPRHKGSKVKSSSKASGTSSLLGVRYNGSSNPPKFDRVPEPDYEQIPEAGTPYYENVCRGNNDYENIHLKGEVIYDSPRPTEHHYDKVHNDLHYENVKFDAAVYENLDEKEPTYMNVHGNKSNVYANLDANSKSGSLKSSKSRLNKVTISGNSLVQGTTYDVPRAATHIYDSPQKQIRSVGSTQTSEYDTPKNNRSVLPQSTQIVLKAKSEQKMKIDEIFADCDQDSLEGDRDRQPDIPSPDYGSEEEADGFEDASNDYVTTEFPDEGLGESDTRSYYAEDTAGLEVILEEPEEEYCSSHASEDDLQREVDITYGLKGERRSLDGSEGIGSAEGDTQSTGGSEHYVEEDCASSGIHSEDTPSPGPPADSEKEDGHHRHHHHQQEEEKQKAEEDRAQQDRCVEVYPETVRQRQRNMMASSGKVDIKNWNSSSNNNNNESQMSPAKVKKFLPSVKALRNQFEAGKTNNRSESNGGVNSTGNGTLSHRSSGSTSSLASSTLEKTSSTNSLNSASDSMENLLSPSFENQRQVDPEEPVEPIFNQFKKVDEELKDLMSRPPSTTGWNPRPLLKRLYYTPEVPKIQSQGTTYINIEGFLEKLPSGRKKATFWNAWKRRYFVAKDGVLYYYQNTQAEKPSMKMTLMGGKVECMEPNMIGVDDGKGHYVVVRCSSRQEAERWRRALETHTVEDFASQYVQPWPMPTSPALLRDTLVIDLGSASVRAGVLASQATLPQVFLPSVVATERETRRQVWGFDALAPDVRAASSVSFPIRPSHKITKYSVDLSAISSLLQKTFADLKVDPKNYHIQLSVPRVLNNNTQTELLRVLFDKFGVRSVNLTHQSILALYAYNATSGIVVDIGERMDIVPVIDGYIVDGGVSRVPYGGYRILDHLRQFLYMRNVSLINEVESYIIRHVLENICYCAHHYNTEKARCTNNPDLYEKDVSLAEYFHTKDCPFETISLDFGRFQATEGLFNPDAWGLDHPGLHKLVHKAIMECSMDIRKEMSRSIFLAGGVTQLPGLVDRLTTEIDNLTPPAIRPKVHASPYRYHAAYIGACVLAESPAFVQSRISREDWNKHGNAALRKWSL